MAEISRTALFGKLNPLAYKAIEGATVFCKMRGNPYVELQHWLYQILHTQDSDLHRIVRHFNLDTAALAADMTQALDRLPRGASSISDISQFIDTAVERGWVYGSLMFGEGQVRSGHLVVGMLKTPSLRGALIAAAPFKLEGSTFALAESVPAEMVPALATMLQELVDYRLAAYELRLEPQPVASNVVLASST